MRSITEPAPRLRPPPWHDSEMWAAENREAKIVRDLEKLKAVFRDRDFWSASAMPEFHLNLPLQSYVESCYLERQSRRLLGPGYVPTQKLKEWK